MTGLVPDIAFRPTLPELLHRAAERYGDNDYVVLPHRRISFAEAERASRELARRLVAAGVAKGTRIGIILPTGIDWVVAWLAAGRIGAMPMLFPATYRQPSFNEHSVSPTLISPGTRAASRQGLRDLPRAGRPRPRRAQGGPLRLASLPFLRSIWMIGGRCAWAHHIYLDAPGHKTSPTNSLRQSNLR